jgi:hypothetical protein
MEGIFSQQVLNNNVFVFFQEVPQPAWFDKRTCERTKIGNCSEQGSNAFECTANGYIFSSVP